ncbi:hypothetical protein P43SY_008525 [Pythium insidiosum]|uniref:Uncharacterized protein n=1 Tax=Pythium insidiosum TaxID=114742 RepID=A0AAD5LT72_PYTIN|nr:hypothetical protein P43SY_008525 [Pythium insidiosum]
MSQIPRASDASLATQNVTDRWRAIEPRRDATAAGMASSKPKKPKGYLSHDVPTVDTVIEEDKLQKRLQLAREQHNWKAEAQALLQLGQLMKWKGRDTIGDEYLAQSASLLRNNTFLDGEQTMEA